ncbi:MAG: NADH-quinone oxidoreductase subunit NuoE [Elusimicrobia bacterium]|nr:NADH-quinone oxidoreductase subunit NuoE [Elusimicrobiota bacterium]
MEKRGELISKLQEVQEKFGFISESEIKRLSDELEIFPVQIYEVITFYTQFRLTPPGKHKILVCQGTACHVMGGKDLLEYLKSKFEINEGETTPDGKFSLERVACLGCCGMAPVVVVDEDFYGRMTIQKIDEILKKYD